VFYYNPEDSVVFVPHRRGFGRTVNYAQPMAWLLTVGIPILVILLVALGKR
jgi:uncharacterized membrane protein